MDNEPKTEPGTSPPVTCTWCDATTNRQGDEFTQDSLAMHRLRCRKRPSATVAPTVVITTVADPTNDDGGKSIKSTVATVAGGSSLSSSLEEGQEEPSSAAPTDNEKERGQTVPALWAEHKYCREENGRGRWVRAFNNKEVGMMTTYLRKGWRHLEEGERTSYQGLVAMLHSHIEQETFDTQEKKMAQTRDEVIAAADARYRERLARYKHDPEAMAAWNEAAERITVERESNPIPDDEPVLPVVNPDEVAARLKADKQHKLHRQAAAKAKRKP